MANKGNFNENTRVQIPGALHLVRLGYKYLSNIQDEEYDHSTNILKDVFYRSIARFNPSMSDTEIKNFFGEVVRMCRDNEDLGREFYNLLTASTGTKIIDYLYLLIQSWGDSLGKVYFAGTGLKHLQKDLLKKTFILIPPEPIIKKFNEIIVPLHDKISLMMMDSFNYLDSRDKLMPHLFHDKLKL